MDLNQLPLHELKAAFRFPSRLPFRINDSLSAIQDAIYVELAQHDAVQEIRVVGAEDESDYALLESGSGPFKLTVNIRRDGCLLRFVALERSRLPIAANIVRLVLAQVDTALAPPLFLRTGISGQRITALKCRNFELLQDRLVGRAAFQDAMPLAALPFGTEFEHFGRGDVKVAYDLADGSSVFVTVEFPANLSYRTVWLTLEVNHQEGTVPRKAEVFSEHYFERFVGELDGSFAKFARRLLPDDLLDFEQTSSILGALAVETKREPGSERLRGRIET